MYLNQLIAAAPLLTIVMSLIVAIVSAYLTTRFALGRFYSEKWWERRAAAYLSIIESTHHVREHADTNLTFLRRSRDLPPDGEKRLEEEMKSAMAELRKQRDIGQLLLSENAIELVNHLFDGLDHSTKVNTWLEHLERKMIAIDTFLPAFSQIARRDLKVQK
jgi:ABC-type amino acid transport system permease subunit